MTNLLENKIQDEYGNTHLVANRQLIATYLPNVGMHCTINFKVAYDGKLESVEIAHQGPVAVVYLQEIPVLAPGEEWFKHIDILTDYSVAAAINGLGFSADLVPMKWKKPRIFNAQSSDLGVHSDGTYEQQLAKSLLLHITRANWDIELAVRNRNRAFASHGQHAY